MVSLFNSVPERTSSQANLLLQCCYVSVHIHVVVVILYSSTSTKKRKYIQLTVY